MFIGSEPSLEVGVFSLFFTFGFALEYSDVSNLLAAFQMSSKTFTFFFADGRSVGLLITNLIVAPIDESYTGWQRGQTTKAMTYGNPNPQKMDGCHVG